MKKITTLTFVMALLSVFTLSSFLSKTAPSTVSTSDQIKKVEVYYFHNTRRCATCSAIEKVVSETIEAHFADEKKSGTVKFQSLNIEKAEGKSVGDKLGVKEQSLIITNGSKQMDLTNQAFMYAKAKPDKLQKLIKSAIKNLQK